MAPIYAILGGVCAAFTLIGVAGAPAIAAPIIDSATSGAGFVVSVVARFQDDSDGNARVASDASADAALTVEPAEAGLAVLTESLRADLRLRQILASTLATRDSGIYGEPRPDSEGSPVNGVDALETPSLIAALRSEAGPRQSDAADPTADQVRLAANDGNSATILPSEGVTLKGAARSLVNLRRPASRAQPRNPGEGIADAADDIEADDMDLLSLDERLLDSRMLGDALLAILRPSATFENDSQFSVLGVGQFELDLSSDLQGFTMFEYNSGVQTAFTLDTNGQPIDDPRQAPKEKVDIIRIALNFVKSPTGSLLTIIAAVFFLVLGMVRVATATRN